jgi:sulfatase modifying factor 1
MPVAPSAPPAPWAARSGRDQYGAFADLDLRGEVQRFRWCPPGSFTVKDGEYGNYTITLTRSFWMGETEVTQGFWSAVMGSNPSHLRSAFSSSMPVEGVSWEDSVRFTVELSRLVGLQQSYDILEEDREARPMSRRSRQAPGPQKEFRWDQGAPGFRLPTEAEWEYAARAGRNFEFAGSNEADLVAWTWENSFNRPHPVSLKAPNAWGLRDMSGNVMEWCWDRDDGFGPYADGEVDPIGLSDPLLSDRVLRGGNWRLGWNKSYVDGRNKSRRAGLPDFKSERTGLRLVKSAP